MMKASAENNRFLANLKWKLDIGGKKLGSEVVIKLWIILGDVCNFKTWLHHPTGLGNLRVTRHKYFGFCMCPTTQGCQGKYIGEITKRGNVCFWPKFCQCKSALKGSDTLAKFYCETTDNCACTSGIRNELDKAYPKLWSVHFSYHAQKFLPLCKNLALFPRLFSRSGSKILLEWNGEKLWMIL
jgi:hypothetical protein